MKGFIKKNGMVLLVIFIGFVAALSVIGNRWMVENQNNVYDIVLDYNEIEEMANQSEESLGWWLDKFKGMGIEKVGLAEESFVTLIENKDIPVSAKVMDVVMREADWEKKYPEEFVAGMHQRGFDKHDLLVEAASTESFDFIKKAMIDRYQPKKFYYFESSQGGFFLLDGQAGETLFTEKYKYMNSKKKGFIEKDEIVSTKLMYLNLGMLPSKLTVIQEADMEIIPRTSSYEGWNDTKYAKAVIKSYENMGVTPEYMIVGGECVIGYDDGIETALNYIKENNIVIGLIENTTQLQNILQFGVNEIVSNTDNHAVRIFSVWDYIQNRYQYYGYEGAEEIENTLFRAVVERNVRLIYYKPIKEFKDQHVYVTELAAYEQMFSNLETRLEEHGLRFAAKGESASVMSNFTVSFPIKLLITLGCLGAAILLLKLIMPIPRRVELGALIIGILGILAVAFVAPSYLELLVSFGSAVIFSCLAILYYVSISKLCEDNLDKQTKLSKLIILGGLTVVAGVLIALCGAMMTAAPISSVRYMLEIDIFRGVKLAQILPILFYVIAYLAYFGFGSMKKKPGALELNDLKDMLNTSIQVWMVLLSLVVAGVGVYYILRTGHDSGLEVSSLEMMFRNTLEDSLLARPRTKEFLFAFPAIMMMVYTSVRRFHLWPILFGLGAVVGMTSVVNTFMHIRTPLYLGFVRTGYSVLFGILIGIVGIVIFEFIYRVFKKLEGKLN